MGIKSLRALNRAFLEKLPPLQIIFGKEKGGFGKMAPSFGEWAL